MFIRFLCGATKIVEKIEIHIKSVRKGVYLYIIYIIARRLSKKHFTSADAKLLILKGRSEGEKIFSKKMRKFLAKRLQISKKSLPLHPQLRNKQRRKAARNSKAKKVLKNLVVTKKGLTFVPTFASGNAAIFLAPLRNEEEPKTVL